MDQAGFMSMLQAESSLANVMGNALDCHRSVFQDDVLQAGALDILHDQIMKASLLGDIVGMNDIGVIQRGDGLGFAIELLDEPGLFGEVNRKNFYRHSAVQVHVLGEVNDTHASRADPLQDVVAAEPKAAPATFEQLLRLEVR